MFALKRPLASLPCTVPAMLATVQLRSHAERRQAIRLGLTTWGSPQRAFTGPTNATGPLAIALLISSYRRARGRQSRPTDWSLQLAAKAVNEFDRRRSWRLAKGRPESHDPCNRCILAQTQAHSPGKRAGLSKADSLRDSATRADARSGCPQITIDTGAVRACSCACSRLLSPPVAH